MNKFRSTVNPLTVIINVLLYVCVLFLIYQKTPSIFPLMAVLIIISLGFTLTKFFSYKYLLGEEGLVIIHKRKKMLILYKDIKYVKLDADTNGILYGYGVKRMLVATGNSASEGYLITPEKQDIFLKKLQEYVENSKRNMG